MDKIKDFGDSLFKFVEKNFSNPIFWIVIFAVVIIIMFAAIKDLGDK